MLTQKQIVSSVPLLGFAARSGTGKTTLLTKLIPLLKTSGLRLALIKHTHHKVVFDNAGLTRQLFEKGIDIYADSNALSVLETHDNSEQILEDSIAKAQALPIDLLLVEGFKHIPFNKIELHREALNQPLLSSDDTSIIAIASDTPNAIKIQQNRCQVLDLNNINEIYEWILNRYLASYRH